MMKPGREKSTGETYGVPIVLGASQLGLVFFGKSTGFYMVLTSNIGVSCKLFTSSNSMSIPIAGWFTMENGWKG